MNEIVVIVTPVAALVLLGWCIAKVNYLPAAATTVLPAFAFKVAMPALIIRAFLSVESLPLSPQTMIYVYFGAAALLWVLTTGIVVFLLQRPTPDAAPIAMATSFSNTVMLGLPLALTTFGPEAAVPSAIIIAIDTPLMWLAAVLHIELALDGKRGLGLAAIRPIVVRLATNPIILATLVGLVGRLSNVELPSVAATILELLSGAAVPVALFALGMSLSTFQLVGQTPSLLAVAILKLAIFPAIVFVLATHIFPLDPIWFAVAMLFAALPVGANPYLFAEQYDKAKGTVSASIAVTTVLSLVTVTAILYYLRTIPELSIDQI